MQRFIDAWYDTKSSTKLLMVLDADDPRHDEYLTLSIPTTWQIFIIGERMSLMDIYNRAYEANPDEPWYGILDDDYVPVTEGWDARLVELSDGKKISFPSNNITFVQTVVCPVIPASIVKKMGWLMPPFTKRLYGDNVWTTIAKKEGVFDPHPEIEIMHYHFSNGLAPFDATYEKPSAQEDCAAYEKWVSEYSPRPIVNVVCVNAGNYENRGKEYVEKLFDMVHRNVYEGTAYRFICFTDDPEPYGEGIVKKPLPEGLRGWWNKLYMFKEGVFEDGERVVYFDLDTCIVSGIDDILKYDGDFAMLRDFYRLGESVGSGVMLWKVRKENDVIWNIPTDFMPWLGDQDWMKSCIDAGKFKQPDILQDLFPKMFVSYKVHARFDIPKHARVVCFHGNPRPHEVEGNWVPHVWKVGGVSAMLLKSDEANVPNEVITHNVKHALTLPHEILNNLIEPHTSTLCIVGGGPSVADHIHELRTREKHGAVIWALNNSFSYLKENLVFPHAQIILDARDANADFVPKETAATFLLAVQCSPKTFAAAEAAGGHIIMWCPFVEGMMEALGRRNAAMIGGGDTVGLSALQLAYVFGFRKVHLYGYDSSYRGDANHAYPQALNEKEPTIDVQVNGQFFKCAPWMATQVEQFKEATPGLVKEGMEIHVHGDGLLPYVAHLISQNQEQAAE